MIAERGNTPARTILPPTPRQLSVTRLGGALAVTLTVVFAGLAVAMFVTAGVLGVQGNWWGNDIGHYVMATQRWMATGTPYLASEVAAPFDAYHRLTFLHPPVAMLLFAPFTVLPLALFWTPVFVVAACVISWRPKRWTWPVIALALVHPSLHGALVVGNTDLWVWGAVALGLRFGWPALLVVVKPSLFPVMLFGARKRSFWLGLAILALVCIPFGSLWLDWIRVVMHAPGGLLYSIASLPWLLIPVLAYYTRSTGRRVGEHLRVEVGRVRQEPIVGDRVDA